MNRRNGFSLLELCIVLCIAMILASAIVPAAFKISATTNEVAAAQVLYRINAAELIASQTYGGFMAPSAMSQNNLANPTTSCFPNLLAGSDAQTRATAGYDINFIPGTVSTTVLPACATGGTPPSLYSAYSLTATPIAKGLSSRQFYTDQTKVLRFADGATIPDNTSPIFVIAGLGMSGAGTSSTGTTPSGPTLWQAGQTYPLGAEVYLPNAGVDGVVCSGNTIPAQQQLSSGGICGLFWNISGNNAGPPHLDSEDWSSGGAFGAGVATGAGTYNVVSFTIIGEPAQTSASDSPFGPTGTVTGGPITLNSGFVIANSGSLVSTTVTYFQQTVTINWSLSGTIGPVTQPGMFSASPLTLTWAANYNGGVGPAGGQFTYSGSGTVAHKGGAVPEGCTVSQESGFTTPPYKGTIQLSCIAEWDGFGDRFEGQGFSIELQEQ